MGLWVTRVNYISDSFFMSLEAAISHGLLKRSIFIFTLKAHKASSKEGPEVSIPEYRSNLVCKLADYLLLLLLLFEHA